MSETFSKLIVVIGGGNGIGAACARTLTMRGWRVAVADLDLAAAREVAKEIGAEAYQVDVADLASLEALSSDVMARQGAYYGLVVSSGAFQEKYAPADLPVDLLHKITTVNFEGTFFANRVFGTQMASQRQGSIVNISSVVGHLSSPNFAYGPTKAAVMNLTRSLAAHWGRAGVRVNSVSPGATIVPRVLARASGRYATDINTHMALNRRVEAHEIADSVEFLLSDRASAITGIDILVDAGLSVAGDWGLYGGVPENPK